MSHIDLKNTLSPSARQFHIPLKSMEDSMPENEECDVERAFDIYDAARALVAERQDRLGHYDRHGLIMLVNHLLRKTDGPPGCCWPPFVRYKKTMKGDF